MSYMGLDIGTSGCKAVVFTEEGHQFAEAHRGYPVLTPHPDWAEIDSAELMRACLEVIAEAGAAARAKGDLVEGLGVSSQGEAFTTLDRQGNHLTNAMVSSDARATELARTWSEEFGRERLYSITGHTAHPMFSLFKMLWIRDNQPDVWDKASSFFCCEELLHRELGLEPAISYPLAGRTMLFNVITHCWDEDILQAVGLDKSKLARPLPAGAIVGRLSAPVAEKLGFLPGAVVVAGGHDQPCGALGGGALESGRAMYGMGTVECICPAFHKPVFSDALRDSNLCTYDFTAEGMYTTVAFSLTGGNLMRWYRKELADDAPYSVLRESMATEPTNLMVLPHFTPTGTPHFDPDPTSAILGLKLSTTRGELLRGLMEGVTYEMKLNATILAESGVELTEYVATGGGAQNPPLMQLKADVLGRVITTVAVTEAGCLGVAMLARCAVAGEPLADIAGRWVRPISQVVPNPDFAEVYDERFQAYRKLYPAIKALAKDLRTMGAAPDPAGES
ncbi:MAG: hypothetical protein KAI66_16565 [Lentisphaeria bacterium]|nr:hypothetical protein [Lentisphaeria bacterium]